VEQDRERSESAFSKACTYLNFNKKAKWTALGAAAGTGVLSVALLMVLWLFADLMVWRGRVPAARELSPLQQRRFKDRWTNTPKEDRQRFLDNVVSVPATAKKLAGTEVDDTITAEEKEAIWQAVVFDLLSASVGEEAIDRVLPIQDDGIRRLDGDNAGVLSLVVRELVAGRYWNPVIWVARWNSWWMWDGGGVISRYLTGLTVAGAILGLMWIFLLLLNREMAARATVEATTRLRRAVYHHTFRLGTLAIRALGPSEAVSILTRHIEALHDALFTHLTVYYREMITFLLLLLFAFLVDPLLSLAFLLFALVVWQVGLRLVASIREQGRGATNVAAERLTIIRESLMLMRLVKCYIMEQFNQARIERQLARYGEAQRVRHRAESLTQPGMVLLGGFCALVLLYVGGLLVLFGQLSTAGAVVLATTLLSLYRPVERWLEGRRLLRRGRDAAEQVFSFLERRGEVGQVVGAEFLPPLSKHIEFDNVSLRDPSTGRPMLENVSISILAGQRIGLAGADNLEKHALVYLLPRLLDPSAGEIRIDDKNLRWVTLDSLRTQIGIVMMHNLVFHDTVRNNIGCGDQTFTLPQIIEAAKLAHAHHFIQKLPQGYETPIGELGQQLSVSEQFRIALARAILRDPALMIIEEPEADLDD